MLPKITVPTFEATIPSTKQKITYRPFLVKEEKILLMAMEGKDNREIVKSVSKILKDCINEDIDPTKLAFFDVEYLFLKLRGKSVGEAIDLKIKHLDDSECKHATEVSVDIDSIEVEIKDDHNQVIKFDDNLGIKMKYPTIENIDSVNENLATNDVDRLFALITSSVDNVFTSETVYDSFTKKEVEEFIEQLNQNQFGKIIDFFQNLPRIKKEVKYTCPKCKKDESIMLEGLSSFFT